MALPKRRASGLPKGKTSGNDRLTRGVDIDPKTGKIVGSSKP
jgi:hypothetical protein